MNISTGGPHILLFERDQQLATLLVSELQLAGYTNHTARTAVEVFDAIARYPIRLVLVNLAQAAAARREFWVALDSQRRDRKVQVLTFLCTNLAGYGPRDLEDRSSNMMADIEVDGMMGLMNLVEAVRARIPGPGDNFETIATTQPRLPRVSPAQSSSPASAAPPRPQAQPTAGAGSGPATYRSSMPAADSSSQQASAAPYSSLSPVAANNNPAGQTQASTPLATPGASPTALPQTGYTEKIRAVLYPNQRTWSTQNPSGPGSYSTLQENRDATSQPAYGQRAYAASAPGPSDSALQRLASGQLSENMQTGTGDSLNETGLAQLSRMAQGYRSPFSEEDSGGLGFTTPELMTQPAYMRHAPTSTPYQTGEPAQPFASRPSAPNAAVYATQTEPIEQSEDAYVQTESNGYNAAQLTYPPQGERPSQTHTDNAAQKNISTQTLRASPIQDMPIERTMTGPAITENTRRPDVLSRANYGQQIAQIAQQLQEAQQGQAAANTLASIATPMPPTTPLPTSRAATTSPPSSATLQEEKLKEEVRVEENKGATNQDAGEDEQVHHAHTQVKQSQAGPRPGAEAEDGLTAHNAVLLDIVQSLPPMPALPEQPQSVQPQVLSGRATRSLGKVLLDGHLVPHDRLEVAQNIQRMLRGVDLNYQLGEILLMFKLLTPDQLLAASLVSYGLITTTQISALGRIRQELHSIGLEYDLENLLILFRILTPEQLREVRLSLQS